MGSRSSVAPNRPANSTLVSRSAATRAIGATGHGDAPVPAKIAKQAATKAQPTVTGHDNAVGEAEPNRIGQRAAGQAGANAIDQGVGRDGERGGQRQADRASGKAAELAATLEGQHQDAGSQHDHAGPTEQTQSLVEPGAGEQRRQQDRKSVV